MKIISVVRNFEMYNRLVKNNKNNKGADFVAFDNNQENKYISIRYNEFLNNYDYTKPDWFVFCHEDWEVLEDLQARLDKLDKNCLYGAIGVSLKVFWKFARRTFLGEIKHSDKDGNNVLKIGNKIRKPKEVGTFDCQCLIVHSDLINKYKLRFDENLTWDLYVEDFCINAKENFDISSKALQLNCQHYSIGNLQDRYFQQLKYLKEKYKNAKNSYSNTISDILISQKLKLIVFRFIGKEYKSFFYQSRITSSGKRLIKICKIPVYSRRVK
ncbi:MAG: hypothetical protein R3Y46_04570 [Opitutales bacterium]